MKEPHQLIHLSSLGQQSAGSSKVVIGLVDGPVNGTHPDFSKSSIRVTTNQGSVCSVVSSPACIHGTFTAGILCANSESQAPGICPEALLVSRPLFCEASDLSQCPIVTPQALAEAVQEVVNSGAHVINLSLGLALPGTGKYDVLHKVFDVAQRRGVLIVGASGNQGRIGHNPLFNHPWVIPVAACDLQGKLLANSNLGFSIGTRGIMAPGKDIIGLYPSGGYIRMSGTSVATPFVTGSAAKLRGLFPTIEPRIIRQALLGGRSQHRSIVPPLLDLRKSKAFIESL